MRGDIITDCVGIKRTRDYYEQETQMDMFLKRQILLKLAEETKVYIS